MKRKLLRGELSSQRRLQSRQFGRFRWLTGLSLAALFWGAVLLSSTVAHFPEAAASEPLPTLHGLEQQGREFYKAEQFTEAIEQWRQAADGFQANGDRPRQAMALSNISLAYQHLGQWRDAEDAIQAAIALLSSDSSEPTSESTQVLAQTLEILGRLQFSQGQREAAVATWREATEHYVQGGDDVGVLSSRINQVQALQALGQYRQAQRQLMEIAQALERQPDSLLKAAGYRSLGHVQRVIGDLEDSQQTLLQSLRVSQALFDSDAIAQTYLSLGDTVRVQQDMPTALEYYQQAAAATDDRNIQASAQLRQLSVLVNTRQPQTAQRLWPQIIAHLSELPLSRAAVYARIDLAKIVISWKHQASVVSDSEDEPDSYAPAMAQLLATAIQQARELNNGRAESYALGTLGKLYEYHRQWPEAESLTRQALRLAPAPAASDIYYQWQWQLGRLLRAQQKIPAAIAAYRDAIAALQSLRYDLVAMNPEIQFSFRDEVEPIYRQYVDLLVRSEGSAQNGAVSQENLQTARDAIEALQLAELDNFFRQACLSPRQELDAVVDQTDQSAAVLYSVILADRIEVILKLPQQPLRHYATAIAQPDAERALAELQQNLMEPDRLRATQALSQRVYDWLIRPAVPELAQNQITTLVFVLDGNLRNIPMAALYDGQHYLIEHYGIVLTPGLRLIDPQPLAQERLQALAAGLSESRHNFPPLNYVVPELEQVQARVPSLVLLNQQFTAESLANRINDQPYSVVHLATHGQFSSDIDQTFILAWDQPVSITRLDSLLRSREENRPNAIELLVLSACETAAGDQRAVLGLAGVATRAGARSTLASLWKVNDESTALLISQFYQALTDKTVPKVEALRKAQLHLLSLPQYQRPMFWAAFVLVGNWL